MTGKTNITRNPIVETAEGVLRGAGALLTPMLRTKREMWGATHEEIRRNLPGDDLLPHVRWTSTHAISINAPPESVWPWVVQIGQGRGGFYSYAALENLFGGRMVNADVVLPEFQNPRIGDEIRMHPGEAMPVFHVVRIERPNVFLLASKPSYDPRLDTITGVTWLFHLESQPLDSTRLITRWRAYYEPESIKSKSWFGQLLSEPLDFVMETKMLQGIRERAEAPLRREQPAEPNPPGLTGFQMPLRP